MKKWMWLLLVVLAAVLVMGINGFFRQPEWQVLVDVSRVEQRQAVKKDEKTQERAEVGKFPLSASKLQVSPEKLLAHIQKLNFKRYTDSERSRTRNYITTELKKLGWKPTLEKFDEGVNIFSDRQGTDKQAGAILIAAHYDTVAVSPGADDNASGVAVVLEVARLLGSRSTPRTLQLAFFDQEEAGLLGSKAFAQKTAHLENLRGVIVMDMVGYACYTVGCQNYPAGLPVTPPSDKGDFLAVVGDTEHLPLLNAFQNTRQGDRGDDLGDKDDGCGRRVWGNKGRRVWGDKEKLYLPAVLALPIPLKGLLTPDTLRSDHAPFWYQGVGAVLVTDTANLRTPHYHQSSDVPTNIDKNFFNGAAQVVINATNALLDSRLNLNTQPSTATSS
ncbi:MAG: M20/M25/M40 family metallo-hydrolase [Heteroscytonema crispum UTEX LB 1556]